MNITNNKNQIEISFDQLFQNYYDAIFRFCYHKLNNKSEAEDITSETFTLLFSIWNTFSPKTTPALVSWLYKTAQNKVYSQNRKDTNISTIPIEDISDSEEYSLNLEARTYNDYLDEISSILSNTEYKIFENICILNKSIDDTAQDLDMKRNTVKVTLYRLRRKIKKILK